MSRNVANFAPMKNTEKNSKVESAIRILKLAEAEAKAKAGDGAQDPSVEMAYSGGKDSDVLLQLARESGIKFRAVYKNTTIDPKGTLRHVRDMGVEVMQPKATFWELVRKYGFPSFHRRFCCRHLKEYKVLDVCVQGIRRDESRARAERYKGFEQCRIYQNGDHVRQFFPIIDWTLDDVRWFVEDRGLKLAPEYYRTDGTIDYKRRLGCMGCPLAGDRSVGDFKDNIPLLKAWLKNGQYWLDHHQFKERKFADVYEMFACNVFFKTYREFDEDRRTRLFGSYKEDLQNYFKVQL